MARYYFNSNRVIFNGYQFEGNGFLIPLPRDPDMDMFGGRIDVHSQPKSMTCNWLFELTRLGNNQEINGSILLTDGRVSYLKRGFSTGISLSTNSEGFFRFSFAFQEIDYWLY